MNACVKNSNWHDSRKMKMITEERLLIFQAFILITSQSILHVSDEKRQLDLFLRESFKVSKIRKSRLGNLTIAETETKERAPREGEKRRK